MFSDLLIALKEGHDSDGHYIKDCENEIEHPTRTPINRHIMRGYTFHKSDILAARYIGGIEKFTNIVGYLRGGYFPLREEIYEGVAISVASSSHHGFFK